MDAGDLDLRRLLAPLEVATFFEQTWERQPFTVRRHEPGYYADLFSLADVDRVIAFTRPLFPEAHSFPGGPPAQTYVQGWLPEQQQPAPCLGIAELRYLFAQGRSVVIRSMQHRWPAIASLCRNLEAVFHCPVHANLYLTPPNSQGFEPHIDTHEVFALQIDGTKQWRLYGPVANLPLAEDKTSVPRSRLGPTRDVALEPGDLLYIPRGHAHEAFTTTSTSLHLTVGVNVYRWTDLLNEALAAMARADQRFRETIPPGLLAGGPLPADAVEKFRELLRALAAGVRPEDAARRLGDRFFDGLAMLPDAHFTPNDGADRIDLETQLAKRPSTICRVLVREDGAMIEFPGGQLGGPARIAPALRFIAQAGRFSARELPELGDDAKLVLARRAVREGLLTTIVPGPPSASTRTATGHRQQPSANGKPCGAEVIIH